MKFRNNNLETAHRTSNCCCDIYHFHDSKSYTKHAVKNRSAHVSSRQFRAASRIKLHADWDRLFATAKVIDRATKGDHSNQGIRIRNLASIINAKLYKVTLPRAI